MVDLMSKTLRRTSRRRASPTGDESRCIARAVSDRTRAPPGACRRAAVATSLEYNARGPLSRGIVDPMHVPLRPGAWLFIAAAFSVLWFAGLDARRLHHPDEGRYAEIAREMQADGDWVTPRLDGLRYYEKPPLQYWLTAAAYTAFGVDEWTARLPVALFGWLAVLAIAWAGTRIAGPAAGLYAAAILGSSIWHAGIGHFVSLDAVLSGCLALALAAFLVAQVRG